jgi:hypothetical protein
MMIAGDELGRKRARAAALPSSYGALHAVSHAFARAVLA